MTEQKLDALDLIIKALLDHERRLDKITEQLEGIVRMALQGTGQKVET